jgi:hypothetical protein
VKDSEKKKLVETLGLQYKTIEDKFKEEEIDEIILVYH